MNTNDKSQMAAQVSTMNLQMSSFYSGFFRINSIFYYRDRELFMIVLRIIEIVRYLLTTVTAITLLSIGC